MDCGDCATVQWPRTATAHGRERASSHLSQWRCRTLRSPRSAAAAAACRRTVCVAARPGRPRLPRPPSNPRNKAQIFSSEKYRRLTPQPRRSEFRVRASPRHPSGESRRTMPPHLQLSVEVKYGPCNSCEKSACGEMSHYDKVWSRFICSF